MEEDKTQYTKFLQGDNKALEELMKKYQNNLIFFITRYVKSRETAQDIFQEVVIYLLEHKETYNLQYSFKTYLYTIAKHRTLNYLKKQKQENQMQNYEEYEENIPEEEWLEDVILTKERQAKIRKVIQKMKTEYQLVIYFTQKGYLIKKLHISWKKQKNK